MTGARLLDTSTLSLFIRGGRARYPRLAEYVDEVFKTDGLHLSIVTVYELDRWIRKLVIRGEGQNKVRLFRMLLASASVYGLDDDLWRAWTVAAELHAHAATQKPALKFGDADLLLLATAVARSMRLVTADAKLAATARAVGVEAHVVLIELA